MEIRDVEGQFNSNSIIFPDDKNLLVIVGGNNSGKSTILRSIQKVIDHAFRIDVNRTVLRGEGAQDTGYLNNRKGFENQMKVHESDNIDRGTQVLQDFLHWTTLNGHQFLNGTIRTFLTIFMKKEKILRTVLLQCSLKWRVIQ